MILQQLQQLFYTMSIFRWHTHVDIMTLMINGAVKTSSVPYE